MMEYFSSFRWILFLVLSFAFSEQVLAQEIQAVSDSTRPSENLYWLDGGVGVGFAGGLVGMLEANYVWDTRSIGLKYAFFGAIAVHGSGYFVHEFGAYYGSVRRTPHTMVRIAGGVGVYSAGGKVNPRLGIEAEFMLKSFAAGLSIFPSIMLVSGFSSVNLTLNLSLGKLE